MFPIRNENMVKLTHHNIRVTQMEHRNRMSEQNQPKRRLIHLPRVRMLGRSRPSTSIRITNVKSIKPPDPEIVKKQEEERLRAQLKKEIECRSRTCTHKAFECTLPVVSGSEYCARHLAEDPAYQPCAYVSNGLKCDMPAPADKKETSLCFEHARLSQLHRQRAAAPPPPVASPEALLARLQHYVRPERVRTTSCTSSVSVVSDPADLEQVAQPVDPFKQINAPAVNATVSSSIMECGSGTDSDADSLRLGKGGDCRGGDWSGDEETDFDWHPLRHAGIFTAEEAVNEAKSALKLLQTAYVRQMGRLRTMLQMARHKYLRDLKAEKEQYCSINSQARSGPLTVRERRQLRKLKAYASYHHRHGADAVLARKLHRKRAKPLDPPRPPPPPHRCSFAEGGVRCGRAVLPAARHCREHLLHDSRQVLFTPCGVSGCRSAVCRAPLGATCRYHTSPPCYTAFTLKKDNSDTDSDTNSASEISQSDFGEIEQPQLMIGE